MAYMNQERKATIAELVKAVVPKGWKYTLAVRNHSTLVFTLRQAPVDILGHINKVQKANGESHPMDVSKGHACLHPSWMGKQFEGDLLTTFQKIAEALNTGNHDKSDIQTDYFDVGWYVDINVGTWNDPFIDTVPQDGKSVLSHHHKAPSPKPFTVSVSFASYKDYLPEDWATLSPGKKAWATMRAKAQANANA